MSSTQGSENRQRHHDVRIRLRGEDELKQLDALARERGFHGRTARGDLIRSALIGVPVTPEPPPPPRRMSPLRQQLAALDRLARNLQRILDVIDLMERGVLPADALDRLRTTLPATITEAVNRAALVFDRLSANQAEDDA